MHPVRAALFAAALAGASALAVSATAAPTDPHADSKFLVNNAHAKGVHVLPGLQYKILKSGPATGAHPTRKDDIKVRYEGRLVDGKVFDSSYKDGDGTVTFQLGRLIPGWIIGVQLMRPGDEWEFYIPAEMAYGEKGAGNGVIPPNATLIFKLELVSATPHVEPAAPAK
ncbi:MAG: FKBP-type peptidyl-prolyl cis-trans isomerase [Proteobacteria bacterium]|nr:FKBP-type peptidyl-prolyl cis-trans isomerase [Pseudomonadota bacterium]